MSARPSCVRRNDDGFCRRLAPVEQIMRQRQSRSYIIFISHGLIDLSVVTIIAKDIEHVRRYLTDCHDPLRDHVDREQDQDRLGCITIIWTRLFAYTLPLRSIC